MVWITADLIENTRVELSNGRHAWKSDEPLEKDGEDSGPSPYELLLGSLASCTLITLQLYARHKDINLGRVSARYEHEKREEVDEGGKKRIVAKIFRLPAYDEGVKILRGIVEHAPGRAVMIGLSSGVTAYRPPQPRRISASSRMGARWMAMSITRSMNP